MMKYDIVIPVSYKDCWILKKNIRYIRDNLIGANKIYVILNRDLFRCFKSDFLSKYSVYLIDENCLALNLNFKEVKNALFEKGLDRLTGWYFQQFLKMAFAFYENVEDYYLVWDSDTFPINKISFFDNQCRVLVNPKREHHQPYFDMINKILGDNCKFASYSFISEHMMFKTSYMKELIQIIASKQNLDISLWWKFIIENSDSKINQNFSEFELYGTYLFNNYPESFVIRNLITFRSGGKFFGRTVTKEELMYLSYDFDTVSFERGQIPNGIRGLKCMIIKKWIEITHILHL
nr:DUF6492 family protein [uncultured Prevotella sp.]